MLLHLAARMTLVFLRHPAVAMAQYFMLNLENTAPFDAWEREGDGWKPYPATAALGWFHEAANGGATFERLVDARAPRLRAEGTEGESYAAVEAALFERAGRRTLIVQNASPEARTLKLKDRPARVEALVASHLADARKQAAQIVTLDPARPIVLAPYSVTRIVTGR